MVLILFYVTLYFDARETVWSAKIGNVQLLNLETKFRRRGIYIERKKYVGPRFLS